MEVYPGRVTRVLFELEPTVVKLDDKVVVTAGYFKKDAESPVSVKSLSPREIRSSAGSAEDIYLILKIIDIYSF